MFDWPPRSERMRRSRSTTFRSPVPATGPWEYDCSAGPHHVVAQRPAYMLDANVVIAAGQRQAVPADWKPKAVLVLNWPPVAAHGADLKIDGRAHAVSQHEPLELPVEPGRHTIQIMRPGVAPIVATATVVAADGREVVAIAAPQPSTAKLVFDWPADRTEGCRIDHRRRSQTVPSGADSAPFELVVPPGRHVVQYHAFAALNRSSMDDRFGAGANEAIKPIWTPRANGRGDRAERHGKTRPAVETPTAQPAKKFPIPPAAEQEKIAKQLRRFLQVVAARPERSRDGARFIRRGGQGGSSPAERYVLLVKGAEIAAAAGDLSLSLQGVDTLDAGL